MTQGDDRTTEIVGDCSYAGGGLPAAAISGAAAELYAPLVVAHGGATPTDDATDSGSVGPSRPTENVAQGRATPPGGPATYERREVAEALLASNRRWGHLRAEALASTLADPATRVVVTGQQPGIFGGPLYSLVKALTAGLWAQRLRADGKPAVAVFWVAGEDHDFREVSATSWMKGSELESASLAEDTEPLVPVGRRVLGPGVEELLAAWRETLPSDFWQAEADRLAQHYVAEATFTDAFAGYLIDVLGDRAPLVLDAQDPNIKRLERPTLERLIEQRQAVATARSERNGSIEEAGFDLQIEPRVAAAPLFLHQDGRRRRILWPDGDAVDGFVLDADEPIRPVDQLLQALAEDPSSLSPSALSRPPIQDALLGTSLFVVGPGEMAYLAQSAPLYDLLGVEAPALVMRPSLAILAHRKAENAGDLDLPLADIATGSWDGEGFLAARAGTNPVSGTAAGIEESLRGLQRELTTLDPNLEQPWSKTRDNIGQAMARLESKVDASLARQDELAARRVQETESLLLPGGRPQERALSTAWALGRFGADLPERVAGVLNLDPGRMQVIAL